MPMFVCLELNAEEFISKWAPKGIIKVVMDEGNKVDMYLAS